MSLGDEFDAVAVGSGPDVAWLRDSIVWPEPGTEWVLEEPEGSGWVRHVESYEEFAQTIAELFEFVFNGITATGTASSDLIDPNILNNQISVIITPQ